MKISKDKFNANDLSSEEIRCCVICEKEIPTYKNHVSKTCSKKCSRKLLKESRKRWRNNYTEKQRNQQQKNKEELTKKIYTLKPPLSVKCLEC